MVGSTMKRKPRSGKIATIRDLTIAITGECWITQGELGRLIRKRGGSYAEGVTRSTDLLVRGDSSTWAHGDYGRKEEAAVRWIRKGKPIKVVHDYEFRKLVENGKPARLTTTIAGQPVEWLNAPQDPKGFLRIAKIPGALDREHTTRGRVEQGYLRSLLFKGKDFHKCALCGRPFPIELLVAVHIKPRSECSAGERRDAAHIVFPLCQMGCDLLYERGYVSVADSGRIVVTRSKEITRPVRAHLRNLKGKRCPSWNPKTENYFRWHYERRFSP